MLLLFVCVLGELNFRLLMHSALYDACYKIQINSDGCMNILKPYASPLLIVVCIYGNGSCINVSKNNQCL